MDFRLESGRTAKPAPPALTRRRSTPARITALVAEDDYTLRWTLCDILRMGGYEPLDGEDGVEAMEVAEKHGGTIQLLVTDIMMPRMDGYTLADRVRHLHPGVKVLFITGQSIDRVPESCELLQKPFTPKELLKRTERMLLGDPPATHRAV